MSYEGYERALCKDGHITTADCYVGTGDKCRCGKPFVWHEWVDTTNGEGKETKLRVKTKTPRKIIVYDYTYYIPKSGATP